MTDLAQFRPVLRENGCEWLLDVDLAEDVIGEVLVHLDALQEGAPSSLPQILKDDAWWLALETDRRGPFVRMTGGHVELQPAEGLEVTGFELQRYGVPPFEATFPRPATAAYGVVAASASSRPESIEFRGLHFRVDALIALLRSIDLRRTDIVANTPFEEASDSVELRVVSGAWKNTRIVVVTDGGRWDHVATVTGPFGAREPPGDQLSKWAPRNPDVWHRAPIA